MAFFGLFGAASSLPTPENFSARQADLSPARESYVYKPTTALPAAGTNATMPVAEFPDIAWFARAAGAVVATRVTLAGAPRRIRALAGGDSTPTAGLGPRETVAVAASTAGTLFKVTTALKVPGGNPSAAITNASTSVGSDLKASRDAVTDAVSEIEAESGGGALVGEYGPDVPESIEMHATADYRAVVNYSGLADDDRAFFEHFDEDDVFARARVAGLNPMAIRAVRPDDMIGDKWMPTDQTLRAAGPAFATDTLEAAIADDRLYMVEYEWLANAPEAAKGDRFIHIPKALFAIRTTSLPLTPISPPR
jgi:hypothetical protein